MNITKSVIDELKSVRDDLQNDRMTVDSALKKLGECKELIAGLPVGAGDSDNIIKRFFTTFNINNLSEATLLIKTEDNNFEIIESAGLDIYIENVKELLSEDTYFYKELQGITFRGTTAKIFYETMISGNCFFTLLTLSESVYFKPSKFHMLSDIIMDLIRSERSETGIIYNDLFENVLIEINNLILSPDHEIHSIFLFKFEYMTVFIENIGITSIVELSDYVLTKLRELFGEDVKIFRISLARFILFFKKNNYGYENFVNYQKKGKFDFNYRGIVLPHYHCHIPYDPSKTIYDIFENIYMTEKGIITNGIAI